MKERWKERGREERCRESFGGGDGGVDGLWDMQCLETTVEEEGLVPTEAKQINSPRNHELQHSAEKHNTA